MFNKKLIDTQCQSNTKTGGEERISSENTPSAGRRLKYLTGVSGWST